MSTTYSTCFHRISYAYFIQTVQWSKTVCFTQNRIIVNKVQSAVILYFYLQPHKSDTAIIIFSFCFPVYMPVTMETVKTTLASREKDKKGMSKGTNSCKSYQQFTFLAKCFHSNQIIRPKYLPRNIMIQTKTKLKFSPSLYPQGYFIPRMIYYRKQRQNPVTKTLRLNEKEFPRTATAVNY